MIKTILSFVFAYRGLKEAIRIEKKFQFHFLATFVAIFLSCFFNLSKSEWIMIVFCIAFVLCAELFNTAIEIICNKIEPNIHPQIKIIKDVSAAAVLVVAMAAAIVGAIIFVPKIF